MESTNSSLTIQIKNIPKKPGVYKYYNNKGELLYIGKAKNLFNRVKSYFQKDNTLNRKTINLVKQIDHIEYTIVDTEIDAFLLENNLIKKHQPKYNILLKDSKTYPYIEITAERFPRIRTTRKKKKDGSIYFGPYGNVKRPKTIIEILHNTFPLRTCSFNLSEENIKKEKFKECLEFHLGKCHAPCTGKEKEVDYNLYIDFSKEILNGKFSAVKKKIEYEMQDAAETMAFEKANLYKQKLEQLTDYQSKSQIVINKKYNLDVFTIREVKNIYAVNFFKIRHGSIITSKTVEIKSKLDESEEELLINAIFKIRSEFESDTEEIITNIKSDKEFENFRIKPVKIGDKKKLIELSERNCLALIEERIKTNTVIKDKGSNILIEAKSDLKLLELPVHIECFDNSNLQGTNPVASMVCFKNGKPSKKDYRHFNIKTVVGANDFESMYEIVNRRYKRLKEENEPLPQLIVIDGGKGQLTNAYRALKDLDLAGKISIISIAKRLEEIYYPKDSFPLMLKKTSPTLKLIQQLRDEAHRFAITFHRLKRSGAMLKSEINEIKGIGSKTKAILLKEFKSLSNIKKQSKSDLIKLIGTHKTELLFKAIKKEK